MLFMRLGGGFICGRHGGEQQRLTSSLSLSSKSTPFPIALSLLVLYSFSCCCALSHLFPPSLSFPRLFLLSPLYYLYSFCNNVYMLLFLISLCSFWALAYAFHAREEEQGAYREELYGTWEGGKEEGGTAATQRGRGYMGGSTWGLYAALVRNWNRQCGEAWEMGRLSALVWHAFYL